MIPYRPRSVEERIGAIIADMIGFALALLGAIALCSIESACKPALPPIAGCVAGVYRCTPEGAPEVCSASSRWEPIGSTRCAAVGAVCVAPIDGPAHCARAQTDAAAEAPDASDGGAE